jgi:hypothetical protein
MVFRLATDNVLEYLSGQGLIDSMPDTGVVDPKSCKNFNLLVQGVGDRPLLVKQEPHDESGQSNGDLAHEWQVHQLLGQEPELSFLKPLLPEPLWFDSERSILVARYLSEYQDLFDYYQTQQRYPTAIAQALGRGLAQIHRATYGNLSYRQQLGDGTGLATPDVPAELKPLVPEDLGRMTTGTLKFYELYQRYDELQRAIAQVKETYVPCCLVHNDLKFNNILLHHQWEQGPQAAIVRFIDWEKWLWGDPAMDLGMLLSGYLKCWLKSLVVSRDIPIQIALQGAAVPLSHVQPSLVACIQAYRSTFPEVMERWPDFLSRVMRFMGIALLESIQARLHYYEPFSNTGIALFQVAKTLLCRPSQAMVTVFGMTEADLLNHLQPLVASLTQPLEVVDRNEEPQPLPSGVPQASPLADLIWNLHLLPDGRIYHPDYMPSEGEWKMTDSQVAPSSALELLGQRRHLRDYIHDIYITHEQERVGTPALMAELGNHRVRGLDVDFYQQLQHHNHGRGYLDEGWVLQASSGGQTLVQKDGLTLRIQRSRHLLPAERSRQVGEGVQVWLPPNWLDAGIYGAIGNAGMVPETDAAVTIVFNTTPAGAIALLGLLTQQLNALDLPFSCKVLLDPDDYDRYDTVVLNIPRTAYVSVHPILQRGVEHIREDLQSSVPLFMKAIAPGVGVAEDPPDGTEFGLHRCQLVADALCQCQTIGDSSPPARRKMIDHYFHQAGLDCDRPYLNPGSDDLYLTVSISM